MIKYLPFALTLLLSFTTLSHSQEVNEAREVFETNIDASLDDVWDAFTTTQGLQSWVTPNSDIDFKVGGKWRSNYSEGGTLGDAETIENTILSYDPKRMLSLKATGFPESFPFKEAAKDAWSVFYFESDSESVTKVTVVGLGYNETEQSQKMRSFFKTANKYSMDQLSAAMKKQAAMKKENGAEGTDPAAKTEAGSANAAGKDK